MKNEFMREMAWRGMAWHIMRLTAVQSTFFITFSTLCIEITCDLTTASVHGI